MAIGARGAVGVDVAFDSSVQRGSMLKWLPHTSGLRGKMLVKRGGLACGGGGGVESYVSCSQCRRGASAWRRIGEEGKAVQ